MAALKLSRTSANWLAAASMIERQGPVSTIWLARVLSVGLRSSRLGRGLERAHDDPRGIRAQKESLPVQERGL